MNCIERYEFPVTGQQVRTVLIDGEPWFVGKDVCDVLGIADARDSLNRLDEDDRGITPVIDPLGRSQGTIIINESGLYSLILRSRKPEAKAFKKWVTSEVLPAIRKTGGYGAVAPTGTELLALALKEADRVLAAKEEKILELTPKAESFDDYMSAEGTISFAEAAKILGFGRNDMLTSLRHAKVLMTGGDKHNQPYQKYAHHFVVVPQTYAIHDGAYIAASTTRVKPSGLEFINKKLRSN